MSPNLRRNLARGPADSTRNAAEDYYDLVAETWDRIHGVERHNPLFVRQLRDRLRALLEESMGQSLALELGAGTGPNIDVAASLFRSVIATDISAGMLDVLRRRLAASAVANVSVMRADACNLVDVAGGSVDAAYSIGLLETVPDLAASLAEAFRVIRPGGLFVGITSNADCPWYLARRTLKGGEEHARVELLSAEKLREALVGAGFATVTTSSWGAVPPRIKSTVMARLLSAAEALVRPTPLARYLALLSFSAVKPG